MVKALLNQIIYLWQQAVSENGGYPLSAKENQEKIICNERTAYQVLEATEHSFLPIFILDKGKGKPQENPWKPAQPWAEADNTAMTSQSNDREKKYSKAFESGEQSRKSS